ncbi:MAG TPA: hypothetical protein VKB78_09355, partial [Pirellulales bacterium]|nr:hypothetical protein [Pirellulales bacterium]
PLGHRQATDFETDGRPRSWSSQLSLRYSGCSLGPKSLKLSQIGRSVLGSPPELPGGSGWNQALSG